MFGMVRRAVVAIILFGFWTILEIECIIGSGDNILYGKNDLGGVTHFTNIKKGNRYLLPILKMHEIKNNFLKSASNSKSLNETEVGIYRIHFHSVLNALYNLIHYWGCRPTLILLESKTGFDYNNVFNHFRQRPWQCQPQIITIDQEEDVCLTVLDFRYLVYIGSEVIFKFFTTINDCPNLFTNMRTWIVIASYQQISYFKFPVLNHFVTPSTCQITFFVPQLTTSLRSLSQHSLYVEYGMASRVDLYDVFYSPSTLKTEVIHFADWTPHHNLYFYHRIKNGQGLFGRTVRVLTVRGTCPMVCTGGVNDSEVVSSYLGDLLHAVGVGLNVRHVVEVAAVATFGSAAPNGSFNGFLGELQRGERDLGLMSTSLLEERKVHAVRYGAVVVNGDMRITIKRPLPLVPPTIYVLPFRVSVWLTTLGFLILTYILLLVIHKIITANSVQLTSTPIKQQNAAEAPRRKIKLDFFDQMDSFNSLAARIVMITLFIAALLVFTYYTSVLTSVFTFRDIKLPFETLDELAEKDDYKVITVKDTIYQKAFETAKEGVYKKIWKKIVDDGKRGLIGDFLSGFGVVAKVDKCAYLTNGFILQNVVKKTCYLMFLPHKYMQETFNIPFRKDFPYIKVYSNSLLRLRESGIYDRLVKIHITPNDHQCEDKGDSHTLELPQVYALFVFLLIASVTSLISLIVEKIYYICKSRPIRKSLLDFEN